MTSVVSFAILVERLSRTTKVVKLLHESRISCFRRSECFYCQCLCCGIMNQDTMLTSEENQESCNPVLDEEAKLTAKYPYLSHKPGGSDFLMKRLQKGQKYFDSGDYNMAKAKMKSKHLVTAGPDKSLVTGDHIPTPQDLPQRKLIHYSDKHTHTHTHQTPLLMNTHC